MNVKLSDSQVAWYSGPLLAGTGLNMVSSLPLLILLILPCALQQKRTAEQGIGRVAGGVAEKVAQALENQIF